MTHNELVAMRLPTALRKGIEDLAAADRRTFSDYVRLVLEDHIAAKKKGGRR